MWENFKGMLALPDDPSQNTAARQGLLAAGAALMGGRGNLGGILGDGLMAGTQGYQAGLVQQQQQALRQAQMQQIGIENKQREAALLRPKQIAESLARARQAGTVPPASGPSAQTILRTDQLPRIGEPRQAPPATPLVAQQMDDPFNFHYQNAKQLAVDGLQDESDKEYERAMSFRPEVRDVVEMEVGGRPVMVQLFKDGRPPQVLDGYNPRADKAHFADIGGATVALDPRTGKPINTVAHSVSPDTSARIAQAERERKSVEGRAFAANPANKPLPAAALKMQQTEIDALSTAQGIDSQLGQIEQQITQGKLSFGPVSNLVNQGLNAAGMSTEQSRNFASFRATLEKLRNDSLRLNAGVQTDGDAQRAWNELFANINDTELVKQRLAEIRNINARAAQLRKLNVDQIRANYGHEPLDTSKYERAGAPEAPTAPPKVRDVRDLPKKQQPGLPAGWSVKER